METGRRFRFSVASAVNPGVNEPVLLTEGFVENIREAARMGYEGIEIHVQDPDAVDAEQIRRACQENHMNISGIATGLAYAKEGLCLIHEDERIRKKAVERLKRFADMAARLGTVLLIGRLKGDIPDTKNYTYYEQMLAEGLAEAAHYAASKGVWIMLEAINRYESNYMNRAKEIADFIKRYSIPATKVLMDVFHMNIEEASVTDALRDNFGELGYFHIADSNRMYPGAGHAPLKDILKTLLDYGYSGYVSLECLRIPDGRTAALEGIKYLKDKTRQ
ncbi:sugar phosphate isomerase/epimerase family protein [Extibacter muris]|uniref:sugar phosphate isomerase/epimerase family protein n=1 Tax=Extibacter muris TaxID=1796622 RepID=UPI001D080E8C|nr:sugar phosphate isomerase/epimerase family protein [Extibacter muris]MCB6201916.1 sugar phosphate isomerase/epimerase [Extibacter muris]MCQ4663253.1 sugar phosphate isomerase/epimerase [Extibacter muris]MCQ4692469.1 sugar phosphate isomerase/epimerase [Extibacter muris]